MFEFFDMMDNYEERKVGLSEFDWGFVTDIIEEGTVEETKDKSALDKFRQEADRG